MSAETYWYQDKRIIYHRCFGSIDINDVRRVTETGLKLTAESTPPVHVLVDLSGISNFPRSINVYREALRPADDPSMIGWIIIFGSQNLLLRFIASALAHIAGARANVRVVETLDQAVAFLEEQDSSLIDLDRYTVPQV